MAEDAAHRRTEPGELARYHVEAQRLRSEQESAKAQVLIDRFVAQATEAGLATEELTARPWSGRGRYRTGLVGWYLRRNRSVGVGTDGGFYVLVVPPVRWGRWRTVAVRATPPPLEVGKGAGDGETFALGELLDMRLQWSDAGEGPGGS
jgi:hypothetical protein